MAKSTEETRFYQFPLSLLQLAVRGEIDRKDLVQHIVSWTLVEKSERWFNSLPDDEQRRIEWKVKEKEENEHLPNDYHPLDTTHVAIARMSVHLGITLGGLNRNVQLYERVKAHRDKYLSIVGGGKGDVHVRIRHDLVWNHLNEERMSLRRFRVLAGLYARIGAHRYRRISYNELRYLSAGYKSKAAYEAVQEHRKGSVNGPDFEALDLPTPPNEFVKCSGRPEGIFRYDGALAYWRQHIADIPLTGPEGMFGVTLTTRGACFQLRDKYFPADGSNPTTGRTRADELFSPGERVAFEAATHDETGKKRSAWTATRRFLAVGTIEEVNTHKLHITTDEGRTFGRSRTDARPCPVEYVRTQVQRAREAGREDAPQELLTRHQVRYTRDQLLDTNWLAKYDNGRHAYYSNRMNREELAEQVENDQTVRLKRRIEEEKAKKKAKQKNAALRAQLNELRNGNADVHANRN